MQGKRLAKKNKDARRIVDDEDPPLLAREIYERVE
jgi:hypothetical protein